MAASNETISKAMDVLLRHMNTLEAMALLNDLSQVRGNSSFEESIRRLLAESVRRHATARTPTRVPKDWLDHVKSQLAPGDREK